MLVDLQAVVDDVIDRFLAPLDPAERAQLDALLGKLQDAHLPTG